MFWALWCTGSGIFDVVSRCWVLAFVCAGLLAAFTVAEMCAARRRAPRPPEQEMIR